MISLKARVAGGFANPSAEDARNADLAGACRPFASRQIILQLNQKIRDKSNRLLATIKTLSSGKQEIRDPSNHLLGT